MDVLYYGGSFNPIHVGHLICARAAAEELGCGAVILVPSAVPPHKPDLSEFASFADRHEMCRLACEGDPVFSVSDIEATLPAPNYTLHTVRALRAKHGGTVNWLIGADMAMHLPAWHRPLELLKEASIHVMVRPGVTLDLRSLGAGYEQLSSRTVRTPLIEISASDIRARLRQGKSITHLVPPEVAAYIETRRLYR